ncbi:Ig-like domain-containing protein [Microbacterium sp. CR_7]|uniref:Ig-like domain-containing protein n=1 Tax=Microbacterium sp. CR_7 TaxID=3055792 RepID=UPI0035C133DA
MPLFSDISRTHPRRPRSRRSRVCAALVAGVLLAAGLATTGPSVSASAAAPLACVDTLFASNNSTGAVSQVDVKTGAISPTPVFAMPAGAGTNPNQLGLSAAGALAIVGTTTSIVEYDPAASAAGTTSFTPKPAGVVAGTVGAINPATGLYYYGGFAGATLNLFVYDPVTNAAPSGPVLSVQAANSPGSNGDIAFDKAGRLYFIASSVDTAALYITNGVVPTSGTGATLPSRELSRGATTAASGGVAFGSDGFLYLGGTTSLQKMNPITGAPIGAPLPMTGGPWTDLGSCANPSTAETVVRFDGPRDQPSDQARAILDGGSYIPQGSPPDFPPSTSAPDGTEAPSEPGLIIPGESYTIRQEPVGTTDLSRYDTTWSCADADGRVIASGTGGSGSFTAPSGTGANVQCSFTNVLPPPAAVDDSGVGVFGTPITLAGATNDQPGNGAILVGQTVLTSPAATDGGKRLQTAEGVWTVGSDGHITFTPAPGFSGTASAEYRIVDDDGQTSTATGSATVRPGPAAADDAAATPMNVDVTVRVLVNDVAGQRADGSAGAFVPSTFRFETSPALPAGSAITSGGRVLTVPGQGVYTFDPASSEVEFDPVPGFEGVASAVGYSVADANGSRAVAEIVVTVGSGAVASADAATTLQGVPVEIDVLGNDAASDLGNPCDPGESDVPAGCDTGVFDPASVVFSTGGQPAGAVVSNGGRILTLPDVGAYEVDPGSGVVTFTPDRAFFGATTPPVLYTARDSHGVEVSSSIAVAVTEVRPVAVDDSGFTPFNTPVSIALLDNDRPGDPSAPLVPALTLWDIALAFEEGMEISGTGNILTIDGQGTFVIDENGVVEFTPVPGFTGPTTPVTYEIVDTNGQQAGALVQVTVRPGPEANPDTATTTQGAAATVEPLTDDAPSRNADDSAGEWDTATLRFPATGQPAGAVVSADGRTLTVPGQGTYVVDPATGEVEFTPEPAFVGTTTPVSYTAVDEIGNAAGSTIAVTVTAVTPTATDDAVTTPFNTPITLDLLDNDRPGDDSVPLDPASVVFEPSGVPTGVAAEIRDGGKTLDVAGEGVFALGDDGTVTFTPSAGFSGSTTPVRYTVRDRNGSTATAAVEATVRPGPAAVADADITAQNVPVTVDVLGNDSPGLLADGSDGALDPASVVFTDAGQPTGAVRGADGRTLEVPGQGRYAIDDDGRVTFTPAPAFRGAATAVTYAVTDSLGNSASTTLVVTVSGVDPIARDDTAVTRPGVPVVLDVLDNDSPGADRAPLDPASLRVVGADGSPVTELTIDGEGVWSVRNGTLVFSPAPGFAGTTTAITYSVVDENGTGVTATATVTVTPEAPAPPSTGGSESRGGLPATGGSESRGGLSATGGAPPWLPLGAGLILVACGVVLLVRRSRS